jgi:ABC-2 type transport system permease protein
MKFLALASRNMKEVYRDPVSMLLGLLMPVALLILFASINQDAQLVIFEPVALTPGIIIFSFAFLLMFSAMLLAKDRKSAFLIRLFTTPLRPSDFILSYMLPFLPLALFQSLICFGVGAFLGASFSNVLLSFALMILVALICISLGVILGALLTENQVSGVGSLMVTAIGLFSGVWMDLKMVGGVFETIGYALPFAHAVDAFKVLLSGGALGEVGINFAWIIGYMVILFFLAVWAFSQTMKRI